MSLIGAVILGSVNLRNIDRFSPKKGGELVAHRFNETA